MHVLISEVTSKSIVKGLRNYIQIEQETEIIPNTGLM